ncbi:MAG: phosphoribosylformylglycinamidine synthase [Clostridiales bacterium]|nr:phosphoribosylformylglycinamidine synthase [Clostridiales bacterium]
MVYRVYVERRQGFDAEANALNHELANNLNIKGITSVRVINRYDVEGIDRKTLDEAALTIFSEPQTDIISENFEYKAKDKVLAAEYLPGQFDQRADSCEQCIQLLTRAERPTVRTAKIYIFGGKISESEFESIKRYLINPVECREASLEPVETLKMQVEYPADVASIDGFIDMEDDDIETFISDWGLAMDADDVRFCRDYFRHEKRNPTVTELRVIDTYWSDHCRHTTFLTSIEEVEIDAPEIKAAFEMYLSQRAELYDKKGKKKDISLMDIATIGAKYLKSKGLLVNLDQSEEINACSIVIRPTIDGKTEDWLLMFKNETHNHPTEIEPFGGAATCLGGCIRDPLSGRAYAYQAMRITGAADPTVPIEMTMKGKLPQSQLTVTAANGYSSYGNQVGLATGGVYEIYHPGYAAKRMELGAVVAAAPKANVVRERPEPGDKVILLGGRTGRDGIGGATGSSKSHDKDSLISCGAEVQKGNAPEERKIQRLFRNPAASTLIRRCNDFGAGGVSVAIGELADGLEIDLDTVPKKYEGLDGTELAISESQERMAVVVSPEDVSEFIKLANAENLEATVVAVVTDKKRMVMHWRGKNIVDLSRDFLSSNGAPKHTSVRVEDIDREKLFARKHITDVKKEYINTLRDLNVASKTGLAGRFDSTVGAATVVVPFGGKHRLSAPQYMACKLPTDGKTDDASVMAYGFDPYLSEISPFHGAAWAVTDSLSKLVASGADYEGAYLTFQEYFGSTRGVKERWGKPFAALLGALTAQIGFGIASIGGKDSMSGSFEDLDVPPTLVSFAISMGKASDIITPEFKRPGSYIYLLKSEADESGMPDYEGLKKLFARVSAVIKSGKALSVYTPGIGGIAAALFTMSIGNYIGVEVTPDFDTNLLFAKEYGSFIIESSEPIDNAILIGKTTESESITVAGERIPLCELVENWKQPLEKVFPTETPSVEKKLYPKLEYKERPAVKHASVKIASPKVVIPVFPGTNCEYDTEKAFRLAGASPVTIILRNMNSNTLDESLEELSKEISTAQILMLPGGFSGGDEPDGSGKFITAVLRNEKIHESIESLLCKNDGLILGICNGFQALVKSGLLPYGRIKPVMSPDDPTLTHNTIYRHQSTMVTTRIASVKSPWLANVNVDELYVVPVSNGEGRFTANPELLNELVQNGQIATQYTDLAGNPTSDVAYNPNNSDLAIEGILSPDGRIFGKMGHSERIGENVCKNIPGCKDQKLFLSGVSYFS